MIGVSGDGDSLSIGLGQLCHAIRRNVNMLYILENNGVYGLTKASSRRRPIRVPPPRRRSEHDAGDRQRLLALTLGPPSSPAAFPATRRSWCRSSRPAWRTAASRSST